MSNEHPLMNVIRVEALQEAAPGHKGGKDRRSLAGRSAEAQGGCVIRRYFIRHPGPLDHAELKRDFQDRTALQHQKRTSVSGATFRRNGKMTMPGKNRKKA